MSLHYFFVHFSDTQRKTKSFWDSECFRKHACAHYAYSIVMLYYIAEEKVGCGKVGNWSSLLSHLLTYDEDKTLFQVIYYDLK